MGDLFVGSSCDSGTGTIRIVFKDSTRAGQTVTITYSEGGEDPQQVEILLDENGEGSVDKPLPQGWASVLLQESQSLDHTIAV